MLDVYALFIYLFSDVTKMGFVGCIEDVALQVITWDLNNNKQSKGVIPGCPDQVIICTLALRQFVGA